MNFYYPLRCKREREHFIIQAAPYELIRLAGIGQRCYLSAFDHSKARGAGEVPTSNRIELILSSYLQSEFSSIFWFGFRLANRAGTTHQAVELLTQRLQLDIKHVHGIDSVSSHGGFVEVVGSIGSSVARASFTGTSAQASALIEQFPDTFADEDRLKEFLECRAIERHLTLRLNGLAPAIKFLECRRGFPPFYWTVDSLVHRGAQDLVAVIAPGHAKLANEVPSCDIRIPIDSISSPKQNDLVKELLDAASFAMTLKLDPDNYSISVFFKPASERIMAFPLYCTPDPGTLSSVLREFAAMKINLRTVRSLANLTDEKMRYLMDIYGNVEQTSLEGLCPELFLRFLANACEGANVASVSDWPRSIFIPGGHHGRPFNLLFAATTKLRTRGSREVVVVPSSVVLGGDGRIISLCNDILKTVSDGECQTWEALVECVRAAVTVAGEFELVGQTIDGYAFGPLEWIIDIHLRHRRPNGGEDSNRLYPERVGVRVIMGATFALIYCYAGDPLGGERPVRREDFMRRLDTALYKTAHGEFSEDAFRPVIGWLCRHAKAGYPFEDQSRDECAATEQSLRDERKRAEEYAAALLGENFRAFRKEHHDNLPNMDKSHRYYIGDELGRGNFGVTYEVTDFQADRTAKLTPVGKCVMKCERLPPSALGDAAVLRANLLIKPTATPRSRVLWYSDAFVVDGQYLVAVMPKAAGRALSDVIAEQARGDRDMFALEQLQSITHSVLEGFTSLLTDADIALTHGDVKPGNIFVSADDQTTPRCQLIDYGLSRCTQGVVGQPVGQGYLLSDDEYRGRDIQWLPPETVALRTHLGVLSDLRSLGMILYRLLTGFHPWMAVSPSPEDQPRVTAGGSPWDKLAQIKEPKLVLPGEFRLDWRPLDVFFQEVFATAYLVSRTPKGGEQPEAGQGHVEDFRKAFDEAIAEILQGEFGVPIGGMVRVPEEITRTSSS